MHSRVGDGGGIEGLICLKMAKIGTEKVVNQVKYLQENNNFQDDKRFKTVLVLTVLHRIFETFI